MPPRASRAAECAEPTRDPVRCDAKLSLYLHPFHCITTQSIEEDTEDDALRVNPVVNLLVTQKVKFALAEITTW